MTNRQKRAIGYAMRERSEKRRAAYIIEREGNEQNFFKSKYRRRYWYILATYGERIY